MSEKTVIVSSLTAEQKRWLRSESKRQGLTMSALIKNWINKEIEKGSER